MKKITTSFLIAFLLMACTSPQANQGNDNANVDRVQGKYIYIRSTPTHAFTKVQDSHVDLVDGVINSGQGEKGMKRFMNVMNAVVGDFDFNTSINKMIEQLNSNGVDYDGVVFPSDLKDGYAIKFNN